jgi:hypothetical protein
MRISRLVAGCVALAAMLVAPLAPITEPAREALAQPAADPPARVGRLNYTSGPVSYAPGGVHEWAEAILNYPLTTGTALWTDEGGRAELRVGSTAVRMNEFTELQILALDDEATQLRVAQGTIDVSLRHLEADEPFEVATPSASVMLVRSGHYRIQVDGTDVWVTVRSGLAEVSTAQTTFTVQAGQTVLVAEGGQGTVSRFVATPALGEFDRWALAREQQEDEALRAASQYVPPTMTGYEDLARHGTWRADGGYGWVWFPSVHATWAPYRDGRWVWVAPWGWTWIDHAPWGFAPFHYGRWVLIGGRWAWVPAPRHARPIFAPALVVFIIIGPSVGWFPLAPREVYIPPYHCSPRYRQTININVVNINIINITDVTRVRYTFRSSPKAVTLVRSDAFGGARPVGGSVLGVERPQIEHATLVAAAPVRPDRRSVLGPREGVGAHTPPAAVVDRPVVARRTPQVVPAPPVPGLQAPARSAPVRPAASAGGGAAAAPAPVVTQAPAQRQEQTRPGAPAPREIQQRPAPPQPSPAQIGVPTPRPQPDVRVPPQVAPAPTPQIIRPVAPAPPQIVRPVAPAPTPQIVRPVAPVPHPRVVPQPQRPDPRSPQAVQTPQPQPTPRPAPTQGQVGPARQGAAGAVRPPICDERSPHYDPARCPQNPRR